ncbi:MAG: mandelate racemase/muconate lactonizing enzyme family protein [Verrucomicrobiales bacterium]
MKTTGKIERIDLYPARYPMTGYFKFFAGPDGSTGRACVTIKITTENGVGWGQSVPVAKWSDETLETAVVALKDYFAPALIGHDADDIDKAHRLMDAAIAPGFSTSMPITRAGLDIALWDLRGRVEGKSVTELWGMETGDPLTISWTLNVKKIEDVDALVAEARERGYENFNIKVAPDPDFDVALAKAARAAAPNGFLWADANGGYDPETALKAAPRLADIGVDVLEAPIKPNRIRGYQALKKQGALPIYMDEGVISPTDLDEFIALGMLDGVACKPSRCGGLSSNKHQIELILKHGLKWLGSGLTDPDFSLAAALQLYTAFDLKKPAALNGPQFLAASILKEPIPVVDGRMSCPVGRGLGVEVEEEKLRDLVAQSGLQPITIQ